MNNSISKSQKTTLENIYEISLKSSKAKNKEVFIFEMGSMSDFFDEEKSEKLRSNFLKNNITVKQITNTSSLPKFSENQDFIDNVMSFRYVPKNIFSIKKEILIFDDIVAIYNKQELLIIEDNVFAENQKQLFIRVWKEGQSPKFGFKYEPNHSFYTNLNYFLDKTQIIVWPDADAKTAYKDFSEEKLGEYIKNIILSDKDYYNNSSYIIIFIWSMNQEKMIDIWKFNDNHVDDRSGPLSEVKVYKEGKICDNLGLASGNTLLVLGYEEKVRRQSKNLKDYLDGPAPELPLEITNGRNFFEE